MNEPRHWTRRPLVWWTAAGLLAWSMILLYRDPLRAQWWVHQMRRAESSRTRLIYFQKLCGLRDRAVPAVETLLHDPDPGLRSLGVGVLHHVPGKSALPLLAEAAHDPDPDVARLAMQGLALKNKPKSLDSLVKIMDGTDERRAMMATAALGMAGSQAARNTLLQRIRSHRHAGVRIEAIETVARMGMKEAVPVLLDMLSDDTEFSGVTEEERRALRAFRAVGGAAQLSRNDVRDPPLVVPRRHAVWREASAALAAITGRPPSPEEDRASVSERWHQWWARHGDERVVSPSAP